MINLKNRRQTQIFTAKTIADKQDDAKKTRQNATTKSRCNSCSILVFSELLLVFVIGLIVLGPQRLPVAVKTVVGWIRTLRSLATTVQK